MPRTAPSLSPRRIVVAGLAVLALTFGAVATSRADDAASHRGERLNARLILDQAFTTPGATLRAGVLLEMKDAWHVYWREPGESGLAPTITWTLPPGWRAGPIAWPTPKHHAFEGIHSNVYEGHVLLACEMRVPVDHPASVKEVEIRAKVDWLVCDDVKGCFPGDATLSRSLAVRDAIPGQSADEAWFVEAHALLPKAAPAGMRLEPKEDGAALTVPNDVLPLADGTSVEAVWATWTSFDLNATPQFARDANGVTIRWPWRRGARVPDRLDGIVVFGDEGRREAFAIRSGDPEPEAAPTPSAEPVAVPHAEPAPEEPSAPDPSPATPPTDDPDADDLSWAASWERYGSTAVDRSLLVVVLFALLGGLILNVMPCVLPVLSLKVLGFVDQAGADRRIARRHGFAFGAGVLVSFLALAGLLLVLKGLGNEIGWGFQLQEPGVVLGLAVLMFLVGLNLTGVFEVGAGVAGLAGRAAHGGSHGRLRGSFGTGVLATVIATPCTAPFMGPAIAYAMTNPAIHSLLVFASIGIGMALPYVVLAAFPGWLRFLPRPGPWMEAFRQVMAFPMFATVIWLVWLFGRHTGSVGVTGLLVGLLLVALGAWLFGRFGTPLRGAGVRWIVGHVLALLVVAGGVMWAWRRADVGRAEVASRVTTAPEGWVPYDGRRIVESRAAGVPVFLDFTADWCLTCKANESLFLDTDAVRSAFRKHNVLAMQGDWTAKGPRITRALDRLAGTSSVPLYAIVPPDPKRPVVILDTAITASYIVKALDDVLATP